MNSFYTRVGNGKYMINFETDNSSHYAEMQAHARAIIDGKPYAAVKGKWVESKLCYNNCKTYLCSECGFYSIDEFNFCHHCGADMRED